MHCIATEINSADALVVTRLILENKLMPRDCWLVVFQEKEHYNGYFIETVIQA
jgi:hypothetical protein